MNRLFQAELYRLFKSPALYLSPLIILFFIVQEAVATGIVEVLNGQSSNSNVEFYNMTMFFSPLVLMLPLLAALPYAAVFCEDTNTKALPYILHRAGAATKYCITKYVVVWFSGFAVMFVPAMLFGLVCIFFAKPYYPDMGHLKETAWEVLELYGNGSAVVVAQTFFLSCFSASCAVLSLAASTFLPNQFFAWCFSLILCFGGNFLFDKLHLSILNPTYSVRPPYGTLGITSPYGGLIYMLVYHGAVFLGGLILFYFGVQRSISGGSYHLRFFTTQKVEEKH